MRGGLVGGLLVFLVAMVSLGCSPVYQVVDNYHPPVHYEGLQCIQRCGEQEQRCQQDCAIARGDCEVSARERAKISYNEAVDRYALETERYAIELRDYHSRSREYEREQQRIQHELLPLERRCADGDPGSCAQVKELRRKLERSRAPSEPVEPSRPQLREQERDALMECDFHCGCKDAFNACYIACGGQITQERQCVSNCD